jgi:AAA+ superfamily predicted ATPase
MTTTPLHSNNQHLLAAAIEQVRTALQCCVMRLHGTPDEQAAPHDEDQDVAAVLRMPPLLEQIGRTFALSRFEQALLLLCAAVEFDGRLAELCGAAQGNAQHVQPTFSLALSLLPDAHWSALLPDAPLRRWRLVEVGPGKTLAFSPLRIAERVLHELVGLPHLDPRLARMVVPVEHDTPLPPSHQRLADQIVVAWTDNAADTRLPVVYLTGSDPATRQSIAAAACAERGRQLYALDAHLLPDDPDNLAEWMVLWEREARLRGAALLLDCTGLDTMDSATLARIVQLDTHLDGSLCLSGLRSLSMLQRPSLEIEAGQPDPVEQRAIWQAAIGPAAECLNGQIDLLVSQFNLGPGAIHTAADILRRSAPESGELHQVLWDACRVQARPHLDTLARRIVSNMTWEDLVLPEQQCRTLREIVAHVRQRTRVYEQWGFAAKSRRGLGISALFAGASGTGKTLAAEVIANELRLDLYRIDLSQVVSKYIGETEKNLRRIFDAAETGGAVLLFDEADALFGKRSEVKDSHDRYANIEVSYLLQRMEEYRGLAILTTNLRNALDSAFLRRIRFVVQFPFPNAEQRKAIWQQVFPPATPTDNLDYVKLARLNVAGGNIRNIALGAAFLAADAGEAVGMEQLITAARSEYAKLDKSLPAAEVARWGENDA